MGAHPVVTFGDLLRRHRLAAGLTQEELAARAQVSPRAISDLERGARNRPWRDTVQLLATALRLKPPERTQLEAAARTSASTEPAHGEASPVARAPRTNLPIELTSLVGREPEVMAISQQLRRPDVRLLTLTGPGGIGKTRLGRQTATVLLAGFPNGVFFVDLAPVNDPRLVASTIAQVLGIKESAGKPLIESLKEAVRGREMLLLLDNFEHVAAAAPLVAELLASCPGLKVLVTSRATLHLRGEHEFAVPPLSLPNGGPDVSADDALGYEAVRLFVERAQAVKPDFALTGQNAAAIVEICRRLDGLPLAIELAAARIKVLSPAELVDRLGNRLRLLTGGAKDLPTRQQTLRNTIAWSYLLLSEEERSLFRRLAMFVGGFTLESAAAVGGGARIGDAEAEFAALESLDGLVDKSLILRDESAEEATRFTMLETIGEYAREMLAESGDVTAIARAHASYFLTRVAGTEPLAPASGALVPLAWLERERHNLQSALRWFRDDGDVTAGLRLAAALWNLWHSYGPRSEGRGWLTTFLRLPAAEPRPLARIAALWAAGWLAIAQGDFSAARAELEEGLVIARDRADRAGEAKFLEGLGVRELELGNLAAAHARLEAALGLQRAVGDRDALTTTLIFCGDLAGAEGDDARARSLYEESLAVAENPAWSLRLLGYVALRAGDVSGARAHIQDSLQVYVQERYIVGQVECLTALAGIAVARERWVAAGRLLGAAARQQMVIGGMLSIPDRTEHERFLAATRAALGEEAFAVAWADGQNLTLDQAIAEALAEAVE